MHLLSHKSVLVAYVRVSGALFGEDVRSVVLNDHVRGRIFKKVFLDLIAFLSDVVVLQLALESNCFVEKAVVIHFLFSVVLRVLLLRLLPLFIAGCLLILLL